MDLFHQLSFLPNCDHVNCLLVFLVSLLHILDPGLVKIFLPVLKELRVTFYEVSNNACVPPRQLKVVGFQQPNRCDF